MPAAEPTPEEPPLSYPRTAYALAFILVAGFALITVDALRQRGQRSELEQASETTAVGDRSWYQAPAASPAVAVVYHGDPLFPVGARRLELRETKMTAIGKDDAGKYSVYISREAIPPQDGEVERRGAPVYFLKTGLGEFIKVQPAATESK